MLTQAPWGPNYAALFQWRQQQLLAMHKDHRLITGALEYYRTRPLEFITHWCDTFDPRNAADVSQMVRMPFIMWKRQQELILFLRACLEARTDGLIEKARDAGATWGCSGFSIWMWRFLPGSNVGWGSRKQDLVDKIGVMDSIFEKIRSMIRGLPSVFWPEGFRPSEHLSFMRVVNPANGATIVGEVGDDIGRGGRTTMYFKDESAHYVRPEGIEASLLANTDCQIDISSVNGLGNVFHRRRESGIEWEPGKPAIKRKTNVFVIDWRDDPRKTREWYDAKKEDMEEKGLLHVFRQEIDRNYAASVEGVIIDPDWVEAAIDAHLKIPGMEEGGWSAGFDIADSLDGGPGDQNATIVRKGVVIKTADEWGARDIGVSTRRVIAKVEDHLQAGGTLRVYYDAVGMGSTVKSEVNRLLDEQLMPEGLVFVPWNAAAEVLFPEERILPNDEKSMLNQDYYHNLKAQGWWQLRMRFFRTWRMITQKIVYPVDQLISIDSKCGKLRQLQKELSQPTMGKSTRLKMLVNKKPDGTRSPNLGDATMQVFWPSDQGMYDDTLAWVI